MAPGDLVSLDLEDAWAIDPVADRSGPADVSVRDGVLVTVRWRDHAPGRPEDRGDRLVVAPAFIDVHAHLREPGGTDAETIATGLAAAAHGGFAAVGAMPNTTPAVDSADAVRAELLRAADTGAVVGLLPIGAVSVAREGERLAPLAAMAEAGAVAFSDDGAPIRSATLLRNALLDAGSVGRVVIDHAEETALTSGAEAGEGLVATVLGLAGGPVAAEVAAVERDLAVLADVLSDEPRARLHLTHLSTQGAVDAVRRAKAAGLPVTCDVTPHHVALSDEWLAGARRWAWDAVGPDGRRRDPWGDRAIEAAPFTTALRVNPPLRSPVDAVACLDGLADGTVDAVATDHAPHGVVAKEVEFAAAANGMIGLETALGLLLAAVDAGRLTLARAVAALTVGPARVLGGLGGSPGLRTGEPATLVVFDPGSTWRVADDSLRSRARNTPLLGRDLAGVVHLTIANGRAAFVA